jgi:hypothetical protein
MTGPDGIARVNVQLPSRAASARDAMIYNERRRERIHGYLRGIPKYRETRQHFARYRQHVSA